MDEYVKVLNEHFSRQTVYERMTSVGRFAQGVVLSSSFGRDSAIMLDLATSINANIPVVYVDHGCWPDAQTQQHFVSQCVERFGLNLVTFRPKKILDYSQIYDLMGKDDEESRKAIEELKRVAKIEPMERALRYFDARFWLSGVSRDDHDSRKNLPFASKHGDVYKVHPIADWDSGMRQQYLQERNLPVNASYFDIFKGKDQKKECGLHGEGI